MITDNTNISSKPRMHWEEVGEVRSEGGREDEKMRGESRVESREDKGRGNPKASFPESSNCTLETECPINDRNHVLLFFLSRYSSIVQVFPTLICRRIGMRTLDFCFQEGPWR